MEFRAGLDSIFSPSNRTKVGRIAEGLISWSAVLAFLAIAPLAVAGMPFLLMVGAAPNAIAYQSKQFSAYEFFAAGVPASLILLVVLTLFVWKIWPWMGMPVLL